MSEEGSEEGSQDSVVSASSAVIPDQFNFWGREYSRHNFKKQSLYAIFFIISHTLDLVRYLNSSEQAAAFAYLTGGTLHNPTTEEA